MFTGIVTAQGRLESVQAGGEGLRIRVSSITGHLDLADCRSGDSISVSGACLTMLNPGGGGFEADVSAETLALTTLGDKKQGAPLNLELALKASDRLGGHLVSGHVDERVALISRQALGESQTMSFRLPERLARFVCEKGSVCLDGVSLTVNSVSPGSFSVCVIPHTLATTTLGGLEADDEVNLEVDMIARYLDRLK